jgi:4-hydroxy-2-oxoheptanedioate aldolase
MRPNRGLSKSNRLKHIVEGGGVAIGACTQIPSTALVEILGLVGFDFTMIDTEHGLFDLQTAGELIRAAQGAGLTPLVRVANNNPDLILKALDLGAQGVVVPRISTKEDAVRALEACKYGMGRGACPLIRAAHYGLWDWKSYQDWADRETMAILLIEDLEAADQIETILEVPGIDVIFLGPFDMSVSAGLQGEVGHPLIQQALNKILRTCNDREIPVMCALTAGQDVNNWVERGVRIVMQSADSVVFARAQKAFLDTVSHFKQSSENMDKTTQTRSNP